MDDGGDSERQTPRREGETGGRRAASGSPRPPTEPVAGQGGSASIRRSAEETEDDRRAQTARVLRQAGPYLNAAWTMTAALLVGAFGGHWLDGRFGTGPWLTLGGILLGLLVGFYEIARVAFGSAGGRAGDDEGRRRK